MTYNAFASPTSDTTPYLDRRKIESCSVFENALVFKCLFASTATVASASEFLDGVCESFDVAKTKPDEAISFTRIDSVQERVESCKKSILCEKPQEPLSSYFLRGRPNAYILRGRLYAVDAFCQANVFTNFERDIEATTQWPSIKKTDIVSTELAKRIYLCGIEVRCDAFYCKSPARHEVSADVLRIWFWPYTVGCVSRDGDLVCAWKVFRNRRFSRKSVNEKCLQFCFALSPLRLPIYVMERLFNELLYLEAADEMQPFVPRFKQGCEAAICESVFCQLEKLWNVQKIGTIRDVMRRVYWK